MSVTRATTAGDGRRSTRTRADTIEALRLYVETYGELTAACFSPSSAKWNDRPELVERYYAGRPDGLSWPSLNTIKQQFGGSFNSAREAVGLPPNTPGPASARRPAGRHRPVRDVRERLVYVGDERLDRATAERRKALERAARSQERSLRLTAEIAELRRELRELRRRPTERVVVQEHVVRERARPEIRTRVKTKTVKVKDERAIERLKTQLADERAAYRALRDQVRATERDRDKFRAAADEARSSLAESVADEQRIARELDSTRDRLTGAESRIQLLREERDEALARDVGAVESAAVSGLVREADRRADAAEVRAARAEREALEHAAAMTGASRKLTAAELDEFRAAGPAGPQLMARALKRLASVRAHGGNLDEALVEVAKAAVNWRDRVQDR